MRLDKIIITRQEAITPEHIFSKLIFALCIKCHDADNPPCLS
jgi:hypothetical protein